jgi:hypothetical protein
MPVVMSFEPLEEKPVSLRGRVKNGLVVLDVPTTLPEGTAVQVRPMKGRAAGFPRGRHKRTLAERLAPVIGKAEGMPADFAANIDHYLYGAPKRK